MEYIRIELESDLCVSNGEASGTSVGYDICTDSYGIPYIPARRIKGCLRQAAEYLMAAGYPIATQENIQLLFGDAFGTEGLFYLSDGKMEDYEQMQRWLDRAQKSNENMVLKKASHPMNVKRMFSSVRGQMRMRNGVMVDGTLHFTRVLDQYNPLNNKPHVFYAPVVMNTEDDKLLELMKASCKALRHMGLNRNRGLGDVSVAYCMNSEEKDMTENRIHWDEVQRMLDAVEPDSAKKLQISYRISLDAPVSMPGVGGMDTFIPGRSVIGCMAGAYLKEHLADDVFEELFLNGTVIWSPVTPVIHGKISQPTPLMVMRLKNGNNRIINRFAEKDRQWMRQKPKTMEDSYMVETGHGYDIASPLLCVSQHMSRAEKQRYLQEALVPGMIYGGIITLPAGRKELARQIVQLLREANLNFGRSKTAQYASCSLYDVEVEEKGLSEYVDSQAGETVYVVLCTDLAINDCGRYVTNAEGIAAHIEKKIADYQAGSVEKASNQVDLCRYRVVGGYQATWNLQKPHVETVAAGSVYCFTSRGGALPRTFVIGEYRQEGFGQCKVLTEKEMQEITLLQKTSVDQKNVMVRNEAVEDLRKAMLTYIAKETIKRFVREYGKMDNKVPIRRLRRMVEEAADYEDLLRRVDSIKESDVDSRNRISRRQRAKDMLSDIYAYDEKNPDRLLEKVFSYEPGLYPLLVKNQLMDEINKMWKLPLTLILHTLHYTKER